MVSSLCGINRCDARVGEASFKRERGIPGGLDARGLHRYPLGRAWPSIAPDEFAARAAGIDRGLPGGGGAGTGERKAGGGVERRIATLRDGATRRFREGADSRLGSLGDI